MKLSEFRPGVTVAGVKIGMTCNDVRKVLGKEESCYPVGREFDKDLDDNHFLCWATKGLEVAFDALDDDGVLTVKSRVVAIHVKS